MFTFVPCRAVDKYYQYRGMRPDVRTLMSTAGFGRSVVFVRGERTPDYESAAIYNPFDLRSDAPVFVWDRNQDVREQVLTTYSDRSFWFLDGPTITGHGYEIVGGPLNTDEASSFPSAKVLPAS
jgi:hypothetical protein